MKIQDFCDMNKFEQIMKNWAGSTGLATVAVGADGKYTRDRIAAYRGAMKQLQFLIKPAAGYCNMRCQYCFYRDEQQNRVNPDDCIMSFTTAETLIQRCFAEIEQGGYISFAFQGGEPTLAGLDFFRFFTQTVQKYNQKRVTVHPR